MARLLIVDDVKFISKILTGIFMDRGHEVDTAENGQIGLEKARAEHPDMILTDISMPVMDGLEMTRKLKSDNATRYIPIMIVSATNDQQRRAAAVAAGADEYVTKPFTAEDLVNRVGKLLGGFRMNFAIEVEREIPVITALLLEMKDEASEELEQAIETARGGGTRPMVLDLSRLKKIGSTLGDKLIAIQQNLESAESSLQVVVPSQGVGTRKLIARIESALGVHADRKAAVGAARDSCSVEMPAPGSPVVPGAKSAKSAKS